MMQDKHIHLSPLQLDRYEFKALEIEPSGGHERPGKPGEYPSLKGHELVIGVRLGTHRSDPRRFGIQLLVELTPTKEKPFPYRFKIAIEGWFTVIQAKDDLKAKNIALINGGGVLFGICREVLLSLSHRFSNGPLMLPTLDFRALEEKVETVNGLSEPGEPSSTPLVAAEKSAIDSPKKRHRDPAKKSRART